MTRWERLRRLLINPPGRLGIEELKFPDVIESIQDVERYTYD